MIEKQAVYIDTYPHLISDPYNNRINITSEEPNSELGGNEPINQMILVLVIGLIVYVVINYFTDNGN